MQAFPFQPNEISGREKGFTHSGRAETLEALYFVRLVRERERLLRTQKFRISAGPRNNLYKLGRKRRNKIIKFNAEITIFQQRHS